MRTSRRWCDAPPRSEAEPAFVTEHLRRDQILLHLLAAGYSPIATMLRRSIEFILMTAMSHKPLTLVRPALNVTSSIGLTSTIANHAAEGLT